MDMGGGEARLPGPPPKLESPSSCPVTLPWPRFQRPRALTGVWIAARWRDDSDDPLEAGLDEGRVELCDDCP